MDKKFFRKSNILKRIITMVLVVAMLTNVTSAISISNDIDNSSSDSIVNENDESNLTDDSEEDNIIISTEESTDNIDETKENIEENEEIFEDKEIENNQTKDDENIDDSIEETLDSEIEEDKNMDETLETEEELEILESENVSEENINLASLSDINETTAQATVNGKTGNFIEMWQYALENNESITLNSKVILSQQLEVKDGQQVSIYTNGHEIRISETAPTGKDRCFYVDGGNLRILNGTDYASRLRGINCSGDGGVIYINRGEVYLEGVSLRCENTNGKGKAIYVNEGANLTFGLTNNLAEIKTVPEGEGENGEDFIYVDETTNDFIYLDGTLTYGTKSQAIDAFDCVLKFRYRNGCIMIGDKAPESGAIIVDSDYCGDGKTIKLKSTIYPRTVVRGISDSVGDGYVAFDSAEEHYRCTVDGNSVRMEFEPEATYGDSEGTLEEMIELSLLDHLDNTSNEANAIKLRRDVEIEEQINLSEGDKVRIRLNRHKITRVNNDNIEDGRIFCLTEGAELFIYYGDLENGKSTANGGAIYVGEGSELRMEQINFRNNEAKLGSAIYVEENAKKIEIGDGNIFYGNSDNDIVVYLKSPCKVYEKTKIETGIFFLDTNSTNAMFDFKSYDKENPDSVIVDTIGPIRVATKNTPIILTNNINHASVLTPAYDDYEIITFNNKSILKKKSNNIQARFTLNEESVEGSLEEMWNFAQFYGKGTITLLTDITASIGNSDEVPSHPEWSEGFYQMATGTNTNITFDFNGHTLDANMQELINKADASNVSRQLGANFVFSVNQGSTLTLTDSVGGGGIKNVISGMDYPAAVNIAGTSENKSHLIFDNVSVTDCYSGKGAIYSNEYGDIKISRDTVINNNENVINNDMTSASLGTLKLNLYVDENANITLDGIGENLNIGITSVEERFEKVLQLAQDELATNFTSDDDRYMVITWEHYVQLIDVSHKNEAKYIYPSGEERITAFDDAWTYLNVLGGQIDLLKDMTVKQDTYTYDRVSEDISVFNFNGHILTAQSENGDIFINAKTKLKLTDTNSAIKNVQRLDNDNNVEVNFNSTTNVLTYYTTYMENEKLVVDKHMDNLSNIGGIIAIGYNDSAIKGEFEIDGGRYTSDGRLLYGNGNIDNIYVYDCGSKKQVDGMIFGRKQLNINNSVFANNQANTGIVYVEKDDNNPNGILNIDNCIFSGNKSFNGTIFARYNININKTFMCYNQSTVGGSITTGGTYSENGNKLSINTNIKIENCYINKNQTISSKDGDGAGIRLIATNKDSIIVNSEIIGNKTNSNGGGIYVYDALVKIQDCIIKKNEAKGNGGGICYDGNKFLDVSTLWLENTNINNNTANKGGGVYVGIIRCYLIGEVNAIENNNTGFYITKSMQVRADDLTSGNINFRTADIPTREHNVAFAEASTNVKANDILNKNIFKPDYYDIIVENDSLYLTATKDAEFTGVLTQYYSYVDNIANTSTRGEDFKSKDLSVIDTSVDRDGAPLEEARIPSNNDTEADIGWKYIYLEEDKDNPDLAHIIRTEELRMIYEDADLNPNEIDTWADANIFSKYNKGYEPYQIWVLKGNDYTSIKEEDWDIYPYDAESEFDFEPGTVVRLVCKQIVDNNFLNEVVFYDYDITDGYYYNESETEKYNSSTSFDYIKSGKTAWIKTEANGINSDENYSGEGIKYAFGNSTLTRYGESVWIGPYGHKITLNKANNGVINNVKDNGGTVGNVSFGLATALDEEGNIIWNKGLDVPNLFNEGDAIGKTTYIGNNLVFRRTGDTYTFTGVDGLGMSGLDDFYFTTYAWKSTRKLWSNNFWPMDNVESFGSDGHDIKFGYGENVDEYKSLQSRIKSQYKSVTPNASDDSLPHNAFFGMHFSMSFEMPETYSGPLEYWFFGDDEMWIFLDGKLICDIGGVHGSIGQYINLWNYIEKGDTNKHTLSFYYTERGASGSTCWMQFTAPNVYSDTKIPTYSAYRFTKINQYEQVVEGAEFTLYSEDNEIITTETSDENGYVTFSNLEKDKIYKVAETKTASNYYMINNSKYILEYIDGNWVMYDIDDDSKTNVEEVVNLLSTTELPETGSTDAIEIQNMALLTALAGCFIFIIAILSKRKKNKF